MKSNLLRILVLLSPLCLGVDIDNDGVDDTADRCANTPAGALVDAQGVPLLNLDGDCDIDAQDAAQLSTCRSGPFVPYVGGCAWADLDGDGDGDQDDFAVVQLSMIGPLADCVIEVCDAADNNCNSVVDEGFNLDLVTSCGPGCQPCPGQTATSDAACTSQTCSMTCRGDNYDVNANPADGCEVADTGGGHTQATAVSRGSKSCNDGASQDSFSGRIVSDSRFHTNPSVPGFSVLTGAAPDWWNVFADGGFGCVNDYSITFTTTGGGATACYTITFITTMGQTSRTINGNSIVTFTGGSGSYSDDTTLYFKIEKTCNLPVQGDVSYTVSYHL